MATLERLRQWSELKPTDINKDYVQTELHEHALKGDSDAQAHLLRLLQPIVRDATKSFRPERGHSQEDIEQQANFRIIQNLGKFQGRNGARLSTWAYIVALNEARDMTRKEKRKIKPESIEEDRHAADQKEVNDLIHDAEMRHVIFDAMGRIPDSYRKTTLQYLLGGQSYEDIARIEQIALGTVKSRINRGKAFLRNKLSDLKQH